MHSVNSGEQSLTYSGPYILSVCVYTVACYSVFFQTGLPCPNQCALLQAILA